MVQFLTHNPNLVLPSFAVAMTFAAISAYFVRLMGKSSGAAVWTCAGCALVFAAVPPGFFYVMRQYIGD